MGSIDRISKAVKPQVAGFIIKELPPVYSNYRADMSLDQYLKENQVIGIEGIDTRALTRRLRISGAMRGVLSTVILDNHQLVDRARQGAQMAGADWVQAVKPLSAYEWTADQGDWGAGQGRIRRWAACGRAGLRREAEYFAALH